MRKLKVFISILIITFFLAGLFLKSGNISAQNDSYQAQFNNSYSNYRTKYEDYLKAHDKYTLSKRQYEQYNTLSSKEELQKDTADMLKKRDGVLILYYQTLVYRLKDSSIDIPDEKRDEYVTKLEAEINWLQEHMSSYQANAEPQVLADRSLESGDRYEDFISEIYRSLYYISRGKLIAYNARFNYLFNELYALSEKIKVEQREAYKLSDNKIEIIDRWFGEINKKNEDFTSLLDKAETQIAQGKGKAVALSYTFSMKTLNEAMGLLIEEIANSVEITNQIKIAEN